MRIVADGHEAVPAVSGIDEAVRAGLDQAAGAGGAVAFLKVHVSVVCCFVCQRSSGLLTITIFQHARFRPSRLFCKHLLHILSSYILYLASHEYNKALKNIPKIFLYLMKHL